MSAAADVRCTVIGPGPGVEELARRAASRTGLVCLRGRFADGHPVLTSHPLRTSRVWPPDAAPVPAVAVDGAVPVGGGWFGVAAFEAERTHFGYHDHVVRLVDGSWRFESLWTSGRDADLTLLCQEWAALIRADDAPPPPAASAEWSGPDHAVHLEAVERAVELTRAGEIYQVNVCTRLEGAVAVEPAAAFAQAAVALNPDFGAFVTGPHGAVLCLSPELFLRRRGRDVVSKPIKGTLPVGPGNAERLRASAKDVAENVMIVDLVRNDLGRVCEPGSIRPTALLDVVERVGVLHLVSAVAGRLRDGVGDRALADALFPPGSVTGTPKHRALAVIDELEPIGRGAYTGAVGMLSPCWGAEFAVAIRTVEIAGGRAELGVGGGITVDSVPEVEWRECLVKAAPVVRAIGGTLVGSLAAGPPAPTVQQVAGGLLETVLVIEGRPVRLPDHLARLDRSVRELFGAALPPGTDDRVRAVAATVPHGRGALRVVAAPDGGVEITAREVGAPPKTSTAVVSGRDAGCWRHKWADRAWASAAERSAEQSSAAVPLFLGADGAVLETSRGNVFLIQQDGTLVTPPLREDLLPGVTRRALLDHARETGRPTRLRTFGLAELLASTAFWTSSLSGAVPITALDGSALPRDDAAVRELASALGVLPGASVTAG